MKVWLVTIGEPLPIGDSQDRLLRAGLLGNALVARGHEVTWWSSTFDHFQKKHWFQADTEVIAPNGLKLKLLHGIGYENNLSLRRIIDHAQIAWKFREQSRGVPSPDLIHCSMPPIELSLAVTNYAAARKIPVVLDMRDMWPDIFVDVFPDCVKSFARLMLSPWFYMLRKACSQAASIVGMSPAFVDWGLTYSRREKTEWDRAFPFGYPDNSPSSEEIEKAKLFWQNQGLNKQDRIVSFVGTLGKQFDIETVIHAAANIQHSHPHLKFVLAGSGDDLHRFKNQAHFSPNVIFPGRINFPEIWTLLRMSIIGLAPYRKTRDFEMSLPNKLIEYISAGLPVLTTLDGYVKQALVDCGCGVTYLAGNSDNFARTLQLLADNPQLLKEMSRKAMQIFVNNYSSAIVYNNMISYFERLRCVNSDSLLMR